MKRSYTLINLFIVAFIASVLSFFIFLGCMQIFDVSPVFASQNEGETQDIVLYAAPRRDTMKNESFIFYNKHTGDLWVYRDEKFKGHYKVTSMGQNLEEIKD